MEEERREEIPEELKAARETTAEETTAEEIMAEEGEKQGRKKKKKERPPKNRKGLRIALVWLQHGAMAVTVFSVLVMTVCSTVKISGVHSEESYTSYTGYSDPGKPFEDSDLFNTILGYALTDVIRFGVVSSQMETAGDFDGDKVVDVTAYNHRSGGLPEQYVTASYRLEDLLKWKNYGFSYTTMEMTEAEAVDFLAKATRVTKVNPESSYYNTSDAGYLKSDVEDYTSVSRMPAEQNDAEEWQNVEVELAQWDEDSGFVEDYQPIDDLANHGEAELRILDAESGVVVSYTEEDEPVYAYDVLVNRYKTAEGRNLEEYVSNWEQYYELCQNVQKAADSLAYNYQEYIEYQDFYSVQNSNVRYLIEKTVGKDTQYYSNMEAGSLYRKHVEQCIADLEKMGEKATLSSEKFIYYCPADMTYVSNTTIEEDTVRQILRGYDYAYPEAVRIWISVDPSYPAKDSFTRGSDYLPNLWQWAVAAFLSGFLYLVLLCYQTMVTGRFYDEKGEKRTKLNAFDRIPTEMGLLIAVGVSVFAVWMLVMVIALAGIDPTDLDYYREAIHEDWFKAAVLAVAFAADLLFTFFFYSLVRRIKARTLWKNSYLYRLVKRMIRFAWKVYDNGSIVIRTWVPYGIFLFVSQALLVWALKWGDGDILLLLFLAAIDVIVGILLYKDAKERQGIVEGIETIAGGQVEYQIDTEDLHGDNKNLAYSVNSIGKGIKEAVEISMKDERMKADLITNVSHDIKTPLTSIINYVDLLKREQVGSEKARDYIRVLDEKSQRLKQLTDDLVEASKITSGNISLHFERINLTELMNQTIGEFSEKFEQKNLVTVMNVNTQEVVIEADSRRIWRVIENLFNNVYKYAMPGTRVYVTIDQAGQERERVAVTIKNISENFLNCKPEELTERFIRGDESRTTEGSGLGLSIAKNLTLAQKGTFEIELDGDLFKVYLTFPSSKSPMN